LPKYIHTKLLIIKCIS